MWQTVIKRKKGWFDIELKEIKNYKDLIYLFVRRVFVTRYKQTILGPAWAIIQPFLTTVVYTLFFGNIAGLGATGIPTFIFYMTGTILWAFFAGCLVQCSDTFISNRAILGKVYFPRMVMPITTMVSEYISLGIQYMFMICFLLYYISTNSGVHPNIFILITPVLIFQLGLLGLGFGIIISAVTTKYRDLAMLVGFGTQLWSFASPVAYDMFRMKAIAPGGAFYTLYMLNPITSIINAFRYAYLGIGQIDWAYYIIGWFTTVVVLFFGVLLFSKVEKTFMDTV